MEHIATQTDVKVAHQFARSRLVGWCQSSSDLRFRSEEEKLADSGLLQQFNAIEGMVLVDNNC